MIFLKIFIAIYSVYLSIVEFFTKKKFVNQLFSYDKEHDKLYACGNFDSELVEVPLEHFSVNGEYTILINNHPVTKIFKREVDGFDKTRTYFLIPKRMVYKTNISVKIIDDIFNNHIYREFEPDVIIDFISLINLIEID